MNVYDDEEEINWYDPANLVKIIFAGFFVMVFVTMFVFPIMANPQQFIENIQNHQDEKRNQYHINEQIRMKAQHSTDCKELQEANLKLLSKGANVDSWFPNSDEKVLKIGLKRYNILC